MLKNRFLFFIFLLVIIIYSIVLIIFFDLQINESFGFIKEQRDILKLAEKYNDQLKEMYQEHQEWYDSMQEKLKKLEGPNYKAPDTPIEWYNPKVRKKLANERVMIRNQKVLLKYLEIKDDIKGFTAISVSIFSIILLSALLIILYLILRELVHPINQILNALEEYINNKRIAKVQVRGTIRIKRVLSQFNDILEKIKIERFNEKMKNSIQNWQMIARMIVHEIKNQISPISLTIDTVTYYNKNLDDTTTTELNKVKENIDFIEKIITNLRDIANLPEPQATNINIIELTKEIIHNNKFSKNNILLCNTTIDFDLYTDRFYLELILINIIKNAFQACKLKEPLITIEFIKDTNYIITVKDNGIGISQENLDKIFKPGFSTKETGSGYGLFIVRELCTILDIRISLESVVNQGTLITLEFNNV